MNILQRVFLFDYSVASALHCSLKITAGLVVLKTAVLVSRLKFCLGVGLEALVSAVFETDQ